MDIFRIDYDQFRIFILVMIRCSAVLFILPVFGSRNYPAQAKIVLTIILAFILFPVAKTQNYPLPNTIVDFLLLVVVEIMFAMCLGLILQLLLAAIQMAGQVVGFQMGLAMVNVVDPQSGTQQSIIAQLLYLTTILLFLSFDGHHIYIRALAQSIVDVRPATIVLTSDFLSTIATLASNMFVMSIKLLAPIIAILLFSKVVMGILAKIVPQMNILMISFPMTISLGLFFIGIGMGVLGSWVDGVVNRDLEPLVQRTVRQMGGR